MKTNVLPSGEWVADSSDANSVNDMTVQSADVVRLERMDDGEYWLGIYVGNKVIHVDLSSDSKITAFMRGAEVFK